MPVKHPIIELNNRVFFTTYGTSLCYNNSIIIIEEELAYVPVFSIVVR